jgi:hypothetical protein
MPQNYRFDSEDKSLIFEVDGFVRRLIYSGRLRPAEIASVAKVLHVLVNLPSVNENVSVTIEVTTNREGDGRFTSFRFSVSNELHLECTTRDEIMTMEWHAYPGRHTERDEYWESEWMPYLYNSDQTLALNFDDCEITVEDDDNPLLFETEDDDGEVENEASPDKN